MFASSLVSFGLYSALMPRRPVTHQLSLISFTTCCGALMLVPFSLWEYSTGATLKFDMLTLLTLAYILIFPSTLAYLFFNRGLALIGPNRAAPFFHLVPVFGSAMAILLLGEQLRLFQLTGYALVLVGVVIASRRASARIVPAKSAWTVAEKPLTCGRNERTSHEAARVHHAFVGGGLSLRLARHLAKRPPRPFTSGPSARGRRVTEEPYRRHAASRAGGTRLVVGKNLTFSAYSAKGQVSNIPRVIDEMKAAGVSVIVTVGFPTALAAKASGISWSSPPAVETRLRPDWESLARPGGTVTGICGDAATV